MTYDKLHSREFVQVVFCTKDALHKVNKALSALHEMQKDFGESQNQIHTKKLIRTYLNSVEEILINANELEILFHRL